MARPSKVAMKYVTFSVWILVQARDCVFGQNEGLAQARRSRLSESSWRATASHSFRRMSLAWARQIHLFGVKAPSLSENREVSCFRVLFELICFIFPKLWELYACVLWCWAWRTKSIESGMCLAWVASEEFVMTTCGTWTN